MELASRMMNGMPLRSSSFPLASLALDGSLEASVGFAVALSRMWAFLTSPEWDAIRNTLATAGGLLALLIAAFTYRRNVRIKREEQAKLVYSKFTHVVYHAPGDTFSILPNGAQRGCGTPGMAFKPNPDPNSPEKILGVALAPLQQVTAIIHNGSKELIGPARIHMVNGGNNEVWEDFSIDVAWVDPESDSIVDFTWINEFHPGMPSLATTLIFRDSSNQWWRRHRYEPIERVHNDPENQLPRFAERELFRRQQEQFGVDEGDMMKEPKLTPLVKLHRRVRTLRGKSPIP